MEVGAIPGRVFMRASFAPVSGTVQALSLSKGRSWFDKLTTNGLLDLSDTRLCGGSPYALLSALFLRRSTTYVTTVDVIRLSSPPMRMSMGTRAVGHVFSVT